MPPLKLLSKLSAVKKITKKKNLKTRKKKKKCPRPFLCFSQKFFPVFFVST
eukprot:05674.XXX_205952_206132_1 [CDS] Oithona nana genome sequencing.